MEKKQFSDSEVTRKAFLGKQAQHLLHLSSEQVVVVYKQRGMVIPVEASSTLQFLNRHDGVSLADIASALELPHQLIAQRVKKLSKLGLLEKKADPNDLRRTELVLTVAGRHQAALLDQCMKDVSVVYGALYEEIGCDLPKALGDAIAALNRKPLVQRFAETLGGETP